MKISFRQGEKVKIYAYSDALVNEVNVETALVSFPMVIARSMRRAGQTKDSGGNDVTKEDIMNRVFNLPKDKQILKDRLYSAYKEVVKIKKEDEKNGKIINVDLAEDQNERADYALKQIEKYNEFTDEELFDIFRNDADDWAMGELEDVLYDMIDFFKKNTDTSNTYEDKRLNKAIAAHKSTTNFIKGLSTVLAKAFNENSRELSNLKVNNLSTQFMESEIDENKMGNPDLLGLHLQHLNRLTYKEYFSGLGITVDSTQAWNIYLNEFVIEENSYRGKLQLEILDHYGLDSPDILKKYIRKNEEIITWYILQHLRGYKPFITKILLNYAFTGELNSEKLNIRLNEKED